LGAVLDSAGAERWPITGRLGDADQFAQWLTQISLNVLADEVSPTLRAWLGWSVQPRLDSVPSFSWTQLRLDLISSPTTIAAQCHSGNARSCAMLLGLVPTRDRLLDWFDAGARRELVRRTWARARREPTGTDLECVRGSDAACIEVLGGTAYSDALFASGHRLALLQLAIQTGGPGATAHLFERAATPTEQLERIAGVSADSLVRAWQHRIRTTRLPSEDLSPAIGAMSLAWIGIFGLMALRSPRWR
jgi:hypothetical protein